MNKARTYGGAQAKWKFEKVLDNSKATPAAIHFFFLQQSHLPPWLQADGEPW
jgi:hypothetical protein